LSVLHVYFDSPTKLFLDLYLAKFLDISVKSFFLSLTFLEKEDSSIKISLEIS